MDARTESFRLCLKKHDIIILQNLDSGATHKHNWKSNIL